MNYVETYHSCSFGNLKKWNPDPRLWQLTTVQYEPPHVSCLDAITDAIRSVTSE